GRPRASGAAAVRRRWWRARGWLRWTVVLQLRERFVQFTQPLLCLLPQAFVGSEPVRVPVLDQVAISVTDGLLARAGREPEHLQPFFGVILHAIDAWRPTYRREARSPSGVRDRRRRRGASFQLAFRSQPVLEVVTVFAAAGKVQIVGAASDVAGCG